MTSAIFTRLILHIIFCVSSVYYLLLVSNYLVDDQSALRKRMQHSFVSNVM